MASKISFDLPNGKKIPALGYGTFAAADAELEKALNIALEAGYRHIDTATLYNNEKVIGKVIKEWIDSGKVTRNELFITTKLPPIAVRKEDVPKFIKMSLDNLQLAYLDLYLIHCPFGLNNVDDSNQMPLTPEGLADMDFKTDLVATWKAMEEQVDAGLTKLIGISNFNLRQTQLILDNARIKPAVNQFELHVYCQQKDLVELCKQNGIFITSYSTLGCPGYADFLVKCGRELPSSMPDILDNPVVTDIAKKHNKSPAQVLLRNEIQKGVACIPKSVTQARIYQNIDIFDFELDADDVAKLRGLDQGPKAKIIDFGLFPGIHNHPEFPL